MAPPPPPFRVQLLPSPGVRVQLLPSTALAGTATPLHRPCGNAHQEEKGGRRRWAAFVVVLQAGGVAGLPRQRAPAYPLSMDPEMTCVCGRPMQIVAVHQFAGLKGPMKLLVYSCGQSPVEDGGDHLQLREVPA